MPLSLRWILLLAFLLRSTIFGAAYFSLRDSTTFYAKDTWSYLQPTIEWLQVGTYTTHGEPELFRTPGYAVFLGFGLQFGQVEFLTILLQILLSCLATYLIYRLALEMLNDERPALWSALAYSLESISIIACSWLLSETLYVALLAIALFALLRFLNGRRYFQLILATLSFTAAVYVRPIGYFLPLVLTIAMLLWSVAKHDWQLVKPALLLCMLSFVLLGAWQIRNYRQTGYTGFSVAMTYNLYFHQIATMEAHQQQRPFYEVLDEIGFYDHEKYLAKHPEQRSWTLAERYEFMQREGLSAVWRAPRIFTQSYLRGLAIALFDPGAVEYLRLFRRYPRSGRLLNTMVGEGVIAVVYNIITQQPWLFALSTILGLWLILLYASALLGLYRQPFSLPLFLLLTTAIYHLALSGGTWASGRFRMPLMMVVCILAGTGFSKAIPKLTQRIANRLHHNR